MFNRIIEWIREVLAKMITKTDVSSALKIDVALSQFMVDALTTWSAMYIGMSPWLVKEKDLKSLNLPAAIAAEVARTVTIEMSVTLDEGPRGKYLQEQLNVALKRLRNQVEYGVAKGGLMLKPYTSDKEIYVDFVQADMFYPVSFDSNGYITDCVFSDQRQVGKYYYTRLEFHQLSGENVIIRNMAYKSSVKDNLGESVPLTEVEAWKNLVPEATVNGAEAPLFGYFRYPAANHVDVTSPLGVSCYSKAVNLIEQADRIWTAFLWELESGKRALYVGEDAFDQDPKTGKPLIHDIRLYRTLKATGSVEKDGLFEDWSPTIREQNYLNALDKVLKRIEYVCGLASGTLSDPAETDKTATELKIHKQRTYAMVKDTQNALQDAIDQLLHAMNIYATLDNLAPEGDYTVTYEFDDSVVTDHDLQASNDRQDVSAGLMAKYEYRMRNRGEDEATAKAAIAAIKEEQGPQDPFGGLQVG